MRRMVVTTLWVIPRSENIECAHSVEEKNLKIKNSSDFSLAFFFDSANLGFRGFRTAYSMGAKPSKEPDNSEPSKQAISPLLKGIKYLEARECWSVESKCVLVGGQASGKTSYLSRLLDNNFDINQETTVGAHFTKRAIQAGDIEIVFEFWVSFVFVPGTPTPPQHEAQTA